MSRTIAISLGVAVMLYHACMQNASLSALVKPDDPTRKVPATSVAAAASNRTNTSMPHTRQHLKPRQLDSGTTQAVTTTKAEPQFCDYCPSGVAQFSCGDRVHYLVHKHGLSEADAKSAAISQAANTAEMCQVAKPVEHTQMDVLAPRNESVAACLMVFDDNHYLIEWLAYHYHALPLRRLIIHPDPSSKTTPLTVLKRWDGIINYTMYGFEDIYPKGGPNIENQRNLFLQRQKDFLSKCMLQLKEEGSKWLIVTDVDEYTHVNLRSRDQADPMYNFGYNTTNWTVPSQKEEGSILKLLEHGSSTNTHLANETSNPDHYHLGDPCVGITRTNFGGQEHKDKPSHSNYTAHFNLSEFATHRWRHHPKGNPIGKTMLDLSRIKHKDMMWVKSVHRPVHTVCSKEKAWGSHAHNPLVAYHYSGTLEQESFRSGDHWSQNRTERYIQELKRNTGIVAPTVIGEWLDGFVESVGLDEARRLLRDVGSTKEAACNEYDSSHPGHVFRSVYCPV